MPRGGHRVVKPVKAAQVDVSAPPDVPGFHPTITKSKRVNTDWKSSILAANFCSRVSSVTKASDPVSDSSPTQRDVACDPTPKTDLLIRSDNDLTDWSFDQGHGATSDVRLTGTESFMRPTPQSAAVAIGEENEDYDTFQRMVTEPSLCSASSSIYSRSSASIYSRSSSIFSSEASIYSFDDGGLDENDQYTQKDAFDVTLDSRLPNVLQYQDRARTFPPLKQQDTQDTASRERSTLAKKAALYKNSRLPPQLPPFSTSLPTWSMVCRAAKASQNCYDSHAPNRCGTYIPADSSKDIKAMIVDDQLIDNSRLIIVAIRGTNSQSFTDWSVNTTANPTKPVGFLDEEENACHAGFLRVTKAMVSQVAEQLRIQLQTQQRPASSERPMLVFTGHSAGGAIAAILYSHMLSTSSSVDSELTMLVNQFSNISGVTFGAPPISQTPLSRRGHMPGVFLAFANEGDLVLRTSNAAYFKSLAKLMTTTPPPLPLSATSAVVVLPPPAVKVIRGSRGATVYRQAQIPFTTPPPNIPWEELPIWPTPAPSLTNAGDIILLRDRENSGTATASSIKSNDLTEVIFGNLAQHTIEMYLRRVKELALAAMMGMDL